LSLVCRRSQPTHGLAMGGRNEKHRWQQEAWLQPLQVSGHEFTQTEGARSLFACHVAQGNLFISGFSPCSSFVF
jgi:hypothetical protein